MSLHSRLTELVGNSLLLRRVIITFWYLAGIILSYFISFFLRFEGRIPPAELGVMLQTLPLLVVISLVVFAVFRLYSGLWVFVSVDDLVRIIAAATVATNLFVIGVFIMLRMSFEGFPRSVFAIQFILMVVWMGGGRLAMRWLRERRLGTRAPRARAKSAVIVGNMEEVDHLLHALGSENADLGRFAGIVSDEKAAHHLTVRGIRVFGFVNMVGKLAAESGAKCVLILPPYTRPKSVSNIVENCEKAGATCVFRMVPSAAELASGNIRLSSLRKVELEDLLGRPEAAFDREQVRATLSGKAVMVTGAGGSIGSELARQIAHYGPRLLVLMDSSEFNLYTIEMELKKTFPSLGLSCVACDCGRGSITGKVLREHGVQVIYHAAAYKHVPLMESNACACILNNTLGTASLAEQAEQCGVERFIFISSDKAVRPTSMMGVSKRLAERVIQERKRLEGETGTCFVAVRFGNVLGSSGSVVPLFRKQIEDGGPVTVTTPSVSRFFMSIPEAVDLVLQAGVLGMDRDIMVLEMGKPIKIVDLARRMIELSGLRVKEDIEIVFTGLRRGEKEYEELMTDGENLVRTSCEKIWVMRTPKQNNPHPLDLDLLARLAEERDEAGLREQVARMVPEAVLSQR